MSYIPPLDREIKDFYRNHADAVYQGCCFLTGGQADPEELTKNVFLRLLAKGVEFSSDKDARAWMLMTANKLGKKAKPKLPQEEKNQTQEGLGETLPEDPPEEPEQARETVSAPEETEPPVEQPAYVIPEASGEPEEPKDEQPPQEDSAAPKQQSPDPMTGVRKLSRKNRLVALLYYCEGYRKAEVASYLGCISPAVSAKLKKIKKLFPEETGMIRRDIRDAYQTSKPTPEQKDAILERILAEKPSGEGIRGKRWKPKGQLPGWTGIFLAIALVLGAAGYGLYHHGYIGLAVQHVTQMYQQLQQTEPTEASEPPEENTSGEETEASSETVPASAEEIYAPLVATYVTAINEGWNHNRCDLEHISTMVANLDKPSQLHYALLDLDQDSTQELLITDGTVIYDMYCLDGAEIRHLFTGAERNSFSLTKDLMILNTGSNGAANTIFSIYSYFGGNLILYDQLVFDGEKDPENPWFHGFSLSPITEEAAQEILDGYQIATMNVPPIDTFPEK